MKNRFFKTTLGVDAQIFVAAAREYTTAANLAAFQSTAVDGELGIFNAETGVLVPALSAVAADTKVLIAVKRGTDVVETSTPIPVAKGVATKTPYLAPVKHAITITTVPPASLIKNDYSEFVIVETTPGIEPLPRYNFSIEAKAGETWTAYLDRLVAKVNSSKSIEWQNKEQIVTATRTGNNIVLTARDFNSHFTLGLRGLFADFASFAVTAQFKVGAGTPSFVAQAEEEGNIRKGVTTNYPVQNASAAEFGAPASAVSQSATYTSYKFNFYSSDQTRTLDREFRKNYIFLFVPSNGAANPDAEITTIFAL